MALDRKTLNAKAATERRPAVSNTVQRSAAENARSPVRTLQERLGNRASQFLIARSIAPPAKETTNAGAAVSITKPPSVQLSKTTGLPAKVSKANDAAELEAEETARKVTRMHEPPSQNGTTKGTLQLAAAAPSIASTRGPGAGQLSISEPGDAHEREADSVADVVMRTTVRGSTSTSPSTPTVQRVCADCEEEISPRERADQPVNAGDATHVHRSASKYGASQVSAPVATSIHDMQGGGAPLPAATRALFEPHFGANFSGVRVHTDKHAARTASSINAKAFTAGRDIVFGAGQFSPDSQAGRHLLAHELTHVVQQERSITRSTVQRAPENPPPAKKDNPGVVAQLDDEIATWESNAAQDADLMLRAKASRMVLLLKGWWRTPRPVLATQQDLDNFTGDCDRRARTELDTLRPFTPAGVELVLALVPKGFPLTWSGRVHSALTLGIDPVALLTIGAKANSKLLMRSIALGPDLALHGLPVPYENLERLNDFKLRISDAKAEKPSPVREFAIEGIGYIQLKWLLAFAFAWENLVNQVAEAVADGKRVPSFHDWKEFVDNKQPILRDLPARARERIAKTEEEIQKIRTDAIALGEAALVVGMASGLLSIFAILGGWNDVTRQFGASLTSADSSVASDGAGQHLLKSAKWAWGNDYFSGAGIAAGRAMVEQAPETLGEMALFMALGMIPPLEIPLAIYLWVKIGIDVAKLIVELASAIDDVVKAKTVCDLQKAAARLATILTSTAIFAAILAITFGIGKAVTKLRKNAADLKKANPALTEEEATRKAMEQLSKEEREALQGTKVKTAKRVAEKFEEFSGVCRIGSILCDGIPEAIKKEVGAPPPTKYNVPPPKGSFNIQKAAFSTAERDPAFLQKQVLANPGRWPHFEAALKANGGKWPVDVAGKSWQVHHIKPAGMGGGSEVDNLFPLPAADHTALTNYWNSVRRAFERRFTKAEWDAIYTKSIKNVSGSDVPEAPIPR
jgi:uncharacterized protein DUF4157